MRACSEEFSTKTFAKITSTRENLYRVFCDSSEEFRSCSIRLYSDSEAWTEQLRKKMWRVFISPPGYGPCSFKVTSHLVVSLSFLFIVISPASSQKKPLGITRCNQIYQIISWWRLVGILIALMRSLSHLYVSVSSSCLEIWVVRTIIRNVNGERVILLLLGNLSTLSVPSPKTHSCTIARILASLPQQIEVRNILVRCKIELASPNYLLQPIKTYLFSILEIWKISNTEFCLNTGL